MTEKNITPKRLKRLLKKMIDIYSPSGKEEELADFLYGYLKRQELNVIYQDVDEDRYNLLILPDDMDIEMALIGHIDTVWAYDLEHYCYEEEDDIITGLGTADMKGNCAAMIEAYLSLQEKYQHNVPVLLALLVGEEEDGDGARQLVKDFHFPWAIIGEPTDLAPCMKHFGYLEVQVCTEGKQVHASLADRGQNAIKNMLGLLLNISNYMENKRSDIVYNIRELESSRSGFVVPDRCEAWLDLHLPPVSPVEEITVELEDILIKAKEENPELDGTIRFTTIHRGYEIPEKGHIVKTLKDIYKNMNLAWNPQVFRSHSDANILWTAGIKPVILGAGKLEEAHRPDESVSFEQVCKASEIYFNILNSYLKRDA